MFDPLGQARFPVAVRFIAGREQHKRRMIAVGTENAFGFGVEHFFHRTAGAEVIPHAAFDLEIKPELIGGFKRGFGRTPRMKSHVVQAPVLARLKNLLPRFNIGLWIAGQWKIAAEMRASSTIWCGSGAWTGRAHRNGSSSIFSPAGTISTSRRWMFITAI